MKICTYNILEGGTGRIDPLAEVLKLADADVIVIQEAWEAELFEKLADRLKMDHFHAPNPRNPRGAVGLLTRWDLREAVNYAPLDDRLTRSALHAVVRHCQKELRIIGLHLHARETDADEQIRLAELPAILDIAGRLGTSPVPHVLAGDFNTSHPQQTIDITRLRPASRERVKNQHDRLPREVITRLLDQGYIDAHALNRTPDQFDTSMTTSHPAMRTDYILVTPDLAPRVRSCVVLKPDLARFASDHFPVVAEIDV